MNKRVMLTVLRAGVDHLAWLEFRLKHLNRLNLNEQESLERQQLYEESARLCSSCGKASINAIVKDAVRAIIAINEEVDDADM